MKSVNFLLFITVFTGVYLAGNYYVFVRAFQAFPFTGWSKSIFSILFWFLSISFIISRFTGHGSFTTTHHFLSWTGSLWIVTVFYLLLLVILFDLFRFANIWLHFLPQSNTIAYYKLKAGLFFISSFVVITTISIGYVNARSPKVSKIEIATNKLPIGVDNLIVVLVTDIHLGSLVNQKHLERLATMVNEQNPDLILLAGDLLDEAQAPIFKYNIGEPLLKLHAPLGKYAVPGNHEYIGGISSAQKYIESLRITMLRDSSLILKNNIILIGRDDIQKNRFGSAKRKSISDLNKGFNSQSFTILMDHQPYNLSESVQAGIDLQVSGHTHKGQFWPFNYLINSIFELGYGYKKKNETHFYVSSGYGTWGPPVRIGNRPEIAVITLHNTAVK